MDSENKEFESKLIPIMKEGVGIIQLIFFKRLKDHLAQKYDGKESQHINMLCATIINDIFGTPNKDEIFVNFIKENKEDIKKELQSIAADLEDMRIPLTDALRVQALCDQMEGIDSAKILSRAKELGILIIDREVPLPSKFITLVRRLGEAFSILAPPKEEQKAD